MSDTSNITEWGLYLLLARILGESQLDRCVARVNEKSCWPELLSLSSNHMVTTQLYWVLKSSSSTWRQIDADSQAYLEQIFELNGERNTQLLDETKEILSALNQQNIVPILLKGTGMLLSKECPDIAYRMQLDIDFLVQPKDLEKASSMIREMGYFYAEEAKDSLEIASEERLPRLLKIYEDHKHLPPLLNPNKRVLVELHRHPYSKRFQKTFPVSDLFKRAKLQKNNNLSWFEMSINDQAQLLLTEGYIDAGFKRSFQLPLRLGRDFLDITALLSADNQHPKLDINKKLTKSQSFPQELIKAILTPSDKNTQSPMISRYLHWMQKTMENQRLHKVINVYSNCIRRTINVAHNPKLIRRLF